MICPLIGRTTFTGNKQVGIKPVLFVLFLSFICNFWRCFIFYLLFFVIVTSNSYKLELYGFCRSVFFWGGGEEADGIVSGICYLGLDGRLFSTFMCLYNSIVKFWINGILVCVLLFLWHKKGR